MLASPRSTARGFTLIELLVVIMIIGILAGLLLPAVSMARTYAKKTKTKGIIQNMAAGVERARSLNGAYPRSAELMTVLATADPSSFSHGAPNVVSDATNVPIAMADAWETPISYRSFEDYPAPGSGVQSSPAQADDDPPPNQDTFQIWSFGPDTIDNKGGGDDIDNWSN